MGRRERAVIGGLLSGLGEGLVNRSKNRLEEERERRERALVLLRDKQDREFRRGLVGSSVTDAQGSVHLITQGGDVNKTDVQVGTATAGASASDKRTYDLIAAGYTTDNDEGKVVDFAKVRAHFLSNPGMEHLVQYLPSTDTSLEVDESSVEWLDSQEEAETWASNEAGWFSSDSSDFKAWGGNKEQAIHEKTLEFYWDKKGVKWDSGRRFDSNTAKSADSKSGGSEKVTSTTKSAGSGTKASPYKPNNQDDYDQLSPGDYYINPEDGQRYQRK